MRLQNCYGVAKVKSQWPDAESLQLARREFGGMISKFNREQINNAFDLAHLEKRSGNDRYLWPDIDAILGLLTNDGVFTGSAGSLSHRLYKPEDLIGHGTKEERKAAAKIELDKLKDIFN